MSWPRRFGYEVLDFVVGDDWRVAACVVTALGLTAVLVAVSLPAWWLLPLVAAGGLGASLRRASAADGPPSQVLHR